MSGPQEVRVTANPNSSWLSKAQQAIRENHVVHSPDFLIEKSTRGTSIKLHPKHKFIHDGVNYYSASFDVSESFDKNTIVRVTNSNNGTVPGTYISNQNIPSLYYYVAAVAAGINLSGSDFAGYVRDPAINYVPNPALSHSAWDVFASGQGSSYVVYNESASISAGTIVFVDFTKTYTIASFYDTGSGNMPPMNAGAFYCVNDVPAVPATGSRPSGNLYYPFYPTWDDSSTVTISGSTFNQIFFRPINPMNIVSACINNQTVHGFGQFYTSGSTYAFALPH